MSITPLSPLCRSGRTAVDLGRWRGLHHHDGGSINRGGRSAVRRWIQQRRRGGLHQIRLQGLHWRLLQVRMPRRRHVQVRFRWLWIPDGDDESRLDAGPVWAGAGLSFVF
jgi:hypothetical protein